jgi:hypothetical protein
MAEGSIVEFTSQIINIGALSDFDKFPRALSRDFIEFEMISCNDNWWDSEEGLDEVLFHQEHIRRLDEILSKNDGILQRFRQHHLRSMMINNTIDAAALTVFGGCMMYLCLVELFPGMTSL